MPLGKTSFVNCSEVGTQKTTCYVFLLHTEGLNDLGLEFEGHTNRKEKCSLNPFPLGQLVALKRVKNKLGSSSLYEPATTNELSNALVTLSITRARILMT